MNSIYDEVNWTLSYSHELVGEMSDDEMTFDYDSFESTSSSGGTVVLVPAETDLENGPDIGKGQMPPYAVILHNDPNNSMDYVVLSLQKVFGYSEQKAKELTELVHYTGRGQVWTGMKEHAEFKADQLVACGPDPIVASHKAQPLRVTIEPVQE